MADDRKPKRPRAAKKGGARTPGAASPRGAGRATAKKKGTRAAAAATTKAADTVRPGATAVQPGAATPAPAGVPVVGIGASAGGLEALEQFFRHVPERSGVAYVVVQHMDPNREGALVQLLQRASRIPVVTAEDGRPVERDTVHVNPPGRDIALLHGRLHLTRPPQGQGGPHLPIDSFFRSLAEDLLEHSIGVVLSGMGTDGTRGLRSIKEKAGVGFVQALESAKFDGMPRSAIDAGVADVVAPAEQLPARVLDWIHHSRIVGGAAVPAEGRQQNALEKIFLLLRGRTGNDFSLYKPSTIQRRLARRIALHQLHGVDEYLRFLHENPREVELLFKELLIGVTSFFRDPAAWEQLILQIIPALLKAQPPSGVLRAWVPGCSTGEEAYSLAIAIQEAAERLHTARRTVYQVFATDLDPDAIERARQGVYPASVAADVAPERLNRYFLQDDRGYRIRKEIRESVIFAPQNLLSDPPFTKLDLLSCRNLLIYLAPELQKKIIPLFHYSLAPRGTLFLGSAETIGTFTGLFEAVDAKARIYRRIEGRHAAAPDFPSSFTPPQARTAADGGAGGAPAAADEPPANLQALADRVIAQRFAPAAILTTDDGEILYFSGRTGKFLEPAVGRANLNLFAMAREGLRHELSVAFGAAAREERVVTVRGVRVRTNGDVQTVDVAVQRLAQPKELRGMMMVVITEVAAPVPVPVPKSRRGATNQRVARLERELEEARDEVQTTREQMQSSQEELKSANEELQSTNEELQSTNEELTTSKEEMQSMNEELQTVNQELQAKVDELSHANNDMKNLLNSTDIATLFLDGELLVRRFTPQTARLIKLIPADAGRPVTDIATDLDYPELAEDARQVLRTLVFQVRQVASRDGRWFTVRIMPYRTLENVIDGVVITFTDATAERQLTDALREQAGQLRQLAEGLPDLVWGCGPSGACEYLSPRWVAYTGIPEAEQLGWRWLEQVHADDRERARDEWKAAVGAGAVFEIEGRLVGADGAARWFRVRSVPIRDAKGAIVRWYGLATDLDDLRRG